MTSIQGQTRIGESAFDAAYDNRIRLILQSPIFACKVDAGDTYGDSVGLNQDMLIIISNRRFYAPA